MKTYNLEFLHWKLNVSLLKEKDINKIIYVLGQSRHVKDISFYGYGECTFRPEDEDTHWHPNVEELPAFNRKRASMAIFNVHVIGGNDRFDKLFIYHSNNTRISNWGYVLYNTKTGEQKHKYCIYDDMFDLIMHINKELNKIQRHEDGKFNDKPYQGIYKNVFLRQDGTLAQNDRYRKDFEDLPLIFVSKEVYRNNKSFIEL